MEVANESVKTNPSRGKNPRSNLPNKLPISIAIRYSNATRLQTWERHRWAGYKFAQSQEKFNHLMYMEDVKVLAKNEKERETQIDKNILLGFRNGI